MPYTHVGAHMHTHTYSYCKDLWIIDRIGEWRRRMENTLTTINNSIKRTFFQEICFIQMKSIHSSIKCKQVFGFLRVTWKVLWFESPENYCDQNLYLLLFLVVKKDFMLRGYGNCKVWHLYFSDNIVLASIRVYSTVISVCLKTSIYLNTIVWTKFMCYSEISLKTKDYT